MNYRGFKASDYEQVVALVNGVFHEGQPMEQIFPLLLSHYNNSSIVVEDKHKIVGFLGLLPETLRCEDRLFYGVRVGAVCIHEEYQGQGIGTEMFAAGKALMKEANLDYALISGQGKLYREAGCELFGKFAKFNLTGPFVFEPAIPEVTLVPYNGSFPHLVQLHQLLESETTHFIRDLASLQAQLVGQAIPQLVGGKMAIYLGETSEQKINSVIIGYEKKRTFEVFDYAGSQAEILSLLEQVCLIYPKVIIRVDQTEENFQLLKLNYNYEEETNSGTILYLNEELRNYRLPHTWDLGFI